jgi:hypothetical protein
MDEQSITPRRHRLIAAAATVGIFVPMAVLVSSLFWFVSVEQVASPQTIGSLFLSAVGWEGAVWSSLVIGLSAWLSRPGLRAIAVSAAVVVSTIGQLVISGTFLLSTPSYALLLLPGMTVAVALFTISAFIAEEIARAIIARSTIATLDSLSIVSFALAAILSMTLPVQWALGYFSFGGERAVTSEQGDRYFATVSAIAVLLAIAIVTSAIRRSRVLLILAIVAVVASTVIGFIFQVPEGRWWVDLHG